MLNQNITEYQCKKCGEKYTDIENKWCKPCNINYFKNDFTNWTSGDELIDFIIQDSQSRIKYYDNTIWSNGYYGTRKPNIKVILKSFSDSQILLKNFLMSKVGDNTATIYLAIWKDGPLEYEYNKVPKRNYYETVMLICSNNTQNKIEEFHKEAETYPIKGNSKQSKIYGISQNPNTKDYFMVLQNGYCEKCSEQYTDIRNKIMNGLDNYDNIVVKWIPYNHSQNKIDEILNEAENFYSIEYNSIYTSKKLIIYGISQNPDTKEYFMVLQDGYCEKCNGQYTDILYKWCKPCQLNDLKNN
ncbi:hypothetical protein C1646_756038 [Rhizophagus diaphanus]|nr:hypothetical protein C1646_756038 [Rhizophagus diaphanus] [Rhizophagus sp. MUCL 43196]